MWLAFVRKHAYYGVGMKANVWNYEHLSPAPSPTTLYSYIANSVTGVGKLMDDKLENLKDVLEPHWLHFGRRKTLETSERVLQMMQNTT